jgi:hypothetical protein
MNALILPMIAIGLLGAGPSDYSRPLDAQHLNQATLDAESFGDKKGLAREDGGLRMKLAAGGAETGWKTPQQIRFGGDFSITVDLLIKTLPKPAQEDGAAIGLALAFQNIDQPDFTFLRLKEPNGQDVYRTVDKGLANPMMQQQMMMQQMMMMQQGMGGVPGPPAKPPRKTYPTSGDVARIELKREGNNLQILVNDPATGRLRYLGQVFLGPNDVAGLKLFVSNRNGLEPIDVLVKEVTIHADRINGLGTTIRTVFDAVTYGEPTAIVDGNLHIGEATPGQPQNGPMGPPRPGGARRVVRPQPAGGMMVVAAPAAAPVAPPAVAVALAPAGPAVVAPALPPGVQAPNGPPPGAPPGAAPPQAAPPPPKEPKAKIPLDEIESIRFERTIAMTGRFMGQPNFDYTMPHPKFKPPPEEPKKEEPKKDESKKDEVKKEEPKKDDAKKEEPKKEDIKKEEPKKPDEPKKEEMKKEEPKKEEPKKDEANKEEPKKDEAKKVEPKPDEPKKPEIVDDPNAPPPGTAAAPKMEVKVDAKKNGIRDINLSLSGLRAAPIQQVTVNCQTDKGPTTWQTDTTGSQAWPLIVRRSGVAAWADLFLEPPPGDCFQKDFTVMVMYQDGQNANAQVKADKHSDAKLAVDPNGPANPQPDSWLYLAGDEKLYGKIDSISPEAIKFTTPWQDHLDIPLTRVVGIKMVLLDPKESADSFARRLKARGSEDLLLARTKDAEVVAIPGVLEGSDNDRLLFNYQGKTRKLPIEMVEGLIMAARPDPDQPDVARSTFDLPGGVTVTGRWKALETASWKVETPWGQDLNLPAPDVQGVKFRGGRVTYLSDLIPSKVEEAPFFGRAFPYKRDTTLLGEPLKLDGKTFERGLAVHSRSSLTFDLNGKYATFEAVVGFDEASKGKGRVDCRVFADGKELYANPDFRADGPPVPLKLSVAGAEQLRLLVDFGKGQDTGDRLVWANARLTRK